MDGYGGDDQRSYAERYEMSQAAEDAVVYRLRQLGYRANFCGRRTLSEEDNRNLSKRKDGDMHWRWMPDISVEADGVKLIYIDVKKSNPVRKNFAIEISSAEAANKLEDFYKTRIFFVCIDYLRQSGELSNKGWRVLTVRKINDYGIKGRQISSPGNPRTDYLLIDKRFSVAFSDVFSFPGNRRPWPK